MRQDSASDAAAWPALLLAPLLSLSHLSIAYALVTPACEGQSSVALHAIAALALVLALAMTATAWRAWRRICGALDYRHRRITASDAPQAGSRGSFVALVATLAGALSCLVIVAVWLPLGILPPCL